MCHLSWVAFRECCSVLISDFCRWWSFNLRLCKHFTNGESKYKGDWNQSSMTEIWLSESSPDKIIGPGKFSVANFWLEETRKHQNTTIYIFRNTNTQIQIFNVLWLHMYYQSDADSCIDTGQHRDSLSAPCTPPPPPPRLGGPLSISVIPGENALIEQKIEPKIVWAWKINGRWWRRAHYIFWSLSPHSNTLVTHVLLTASRYISWQRHKINSVTKLTLICHRGLNPPARFWQTGRIWRKFGLGYRLLGFQSPF